MREIRSLHAERVTHAELIYLEQAIRDIDRFGSVVDERGDLVQHNFVFSKMTACILLQGGVLVVMMLSLDVPLFRFLRFIVVSLD